MILVTDICLGIIGLAGVLCVAQLLRAESFADRLIALDLLLGVVVAGTAVVASRPGPDVLLNLLVVTALLGFVSTVTVGRFLERRGV